MAEYIKSGRDMYQVPREMSRKIYSRFGAEMFARFILMIDDYQEHWDHHRTGENFPIDDYPMELYGYFDAVAGRIDVASERYYEKQRGYAEFCETQSDRAVIGVKKKVKKTVKASREKERYVDNREKINKKRREKYAQTKQTKTKLQKNLNEKQADDCTQQKSEQILAGNSANDTGYCNTSLRSVLLGSKGKGVQGENQVIHNQAKKPPPSLSNPSNGLTSSTLSTPAAQKGSVDPTRPPLGKGRSGSRQYGSGAAGEKAVPTVGSEQSSPSGSGRPSAGLGKDGVCGDPAAKYANPEIVITADWELDLIDPIFAPYGRMRKKFKDNFEEWIRDEFKGRSIGKKFISRQIQRSAIKTKELKFMLGDDD